MQSTSSAVLASQVQRRQTAAGFARDRNLRQQGQRRPQRLPDDAGICWPKLEILRSRSAGRSRRA